MYPMVFILQDFITLPFWLTESATRDSIRSLQFLLLDNPIVENCNFFNDFNQDQNIYNIAVNSITFQINKKNTFF